MAPVPNVVDVPEPAPRLLLSASGAATSWGILMSVRERWGQHVFVVATDTNEERLVAASAIADRFYRVPAVNERDFPRELQRILGKENINCYLPVLDSEIVLAGRLRDLSQLDAIEVVAAPTWAAEICWDKLRAADWLREQQIPTPLTSPLESFEWKGNAVCIKPRHGIGSVGVRSVADKEAFEKERESSQPATLLAQELLPGPELTLDCFRSREDGWIRVLCRERVETKAGVCTKARIFEPDDYLFALAALIGQALQLTGSYCLQMMASGDERGWLVTDINPRTGAGTRLSAAVGVDFAAATLAEAWGLPVRALLPSLDRERWVVRQYREIVLV